MGYVDEVLEVVKKKNADQPEFLQAVTEVLDSLRPVIDANEELYRKNAILERITEPDRQIMFRVPWGQFLHGTVCVASLGTVKLQPADRHPGIRLCGQFTHLKPVFGVGHPMLILIWRVSGGNKPYLIQCIRFVCTFCHMKMSVMNWIKRPS